MIFSDFISLIGDFCLYTATVGFVISGFGKNIDPLIPAIVYLVCAAVFLLMRNVKNILRFAPLLLMIPAFILVGTWVGAVWLAPLCILLFIRALTGSWSAEHERTQIVFKIALGVYVLITLFSKASAAYCKGSLPFFLAWLIITVVNLRLLRSPGLDSLGTRFKVLNVLLVVAVAAVVFLLSSDVCINAMKVGFVFLYKNAIMPLFLAVVLICALVPAIIYYIIKLICSLFGGGGIKTIEQVAAEAINEEYRDTYLFKEAPQWIGKAATAAGIVILVVICILVVRKLMAKRGNDEGSEVPLHRETVDAPIPLRTKKRFSFTNSPEDTVRNTYRHYLEFCSRYDVDVDGSVASDRISKDSVPFAGKESPEKLRTLWLPARYSEAQVITPEDAKEAKSLLKDMRSFAGHKDK